MVVLNIVFVLSIGYINKNISLIIMMYMRFPPCYIQINVLTLQVVSQAIESQPESRDAKERAEQFKNKYLERLKVLRKKAL